MDAIDFGSGGKTLYELWHILKALSYFPVFAWCVYLAGIRWRGILVLVIAMCGWFAIYELLRDWNFWVLDNKLEIRWLRFLWGIDR
jgi:cell division protein FtsW (lipid II flippase)